MRHGGLLVALAAVTVGLLLSGCAETKLAGYAVKEAQRPTGTATPTQPGYKIGQPYQVNGMWYYPQEDPNDDQTGIASWYGDPFHGHATANGEVYDQNELTAAHQTLPLPTYVRVTNLENGRAVVVKINDRGPFVNGRIIDLSRRAAQLLGMDRQGTAKVRVQALKPGMPGTEGMMVASAGRAGEDKPRVVAAPRTVVSAEALPPPPGAHGQTGVVALPPAPTGPSATEVFAAAGAAAPSPALATQPVEHVAVKPTGIYVQAGAFTQYDNAHKLSARLSSLGTSRVSPVMINCTEFFRVRIGPMPNVQRADQVLEKVIRTGQADARIVVD
mgnify:CR=1 FL=1